MFTYVDYLLFRYQPDVGLLTSEPAKHDDELNPRIIAPDPFASDDCLDVFSPTHQLLLTTYVYVVRMRNNTANITIDNCKIFCSL